MSRTKNDFKVCYSMNTVLLFLVVLILALFVMLSLNARQGKSQDYMPQQNEKIHFVQPSVNHNHVHHRPCEQNVPLLRNPYAARHFNRIGHLVCERTNAIKPLYGRPKDRRGNKWHYYTSEHIDSNLNEIVQLPIIVNNRECMNDWGCDELYDNDEVRVDNHGNTFRVKLYKQLHHY